jgi:outer membrane immunogenic protein
MKQLLLAAVVASAISSTALAADASMYEDIAQAAHDWSGSYFGLQIGGGFGDSRHTDTAGATTGDFDIDGVIGGYTTGYNWQSGNLVFGLEGDTSLSNLEGSTTVACPGVCYSEVNWLSTYRVRLGWAMDRFLPYVTGGVALGGVKAGQVTGGFRTSKTRAGWAAGGGLEVALSDLWSAKVEYLHADLGDATYTVAIPVEADFSDIDIVRVGVNRKFDIFGYLGLR